MKFDKFNITFYNKIVKFNKSTKLLHHMRGNIIGSKSEGKGETKFLGTMCLTFEAISVIVL